MGRIRAIKPGFFTDSELYDAEAESGLPLRVAYAGLWTVADREGRFRWKPREIKTQVLPYDAVDMVNVLDALVRHRFIFKYKCNGEEFGFIPKFHEHQHVNKNEAPSTIPEPPKNSNARAKTVNARASTAPAPNEHLKELVVRKGKEQEGKGTVESAPPSAAPTPEPAVSKPLRETKGRRWRVDEEIPPNWIFEAEKSRSEHELPVVNLVLEATKFANYWASKTGRGATHSDWKRTWLNWALNAKGDVNGRSRTEQWRDGIAEFLAAGDEGDDNPRASGPPNGAAGRGLQPAERSDDKAPLSGVFRRVT